MTGADEHGQKIADTAEKDGLKPIELVDKCVAHALAQPEGGLPLLKSKRSKLIGKPEHVLSS